MSRASRIIVQTLHTQWTKESRGHPQSAARNATPEVVDLPLTIAEVPGPIAWHDVVLREATGFQLDAVCRQRPGMPAHFQWIEVAEVAGVAAVSLFGRPVFTVGEGETGNVVYNLPEDVVADGWRSTLYHKVSFHISVGLRWEARLFYRPPSHVLRSLRQLA